MKKYLGQASLEKGQKLREAGETLEAIDAINRSIAVFASEKNYSAFAHAILDRAICWQHLYQFYDNDFGYAVLYKKEAEGMLEIVLEKKIQKELALAFYINAKAQMIYGNYKKAVELFNQALKNISPDRKAQRGDWETNLGKALYLSHNKSKGLQEMLQGLEIIKTHRREVDDYTAQVWISGAYLRLAETLKLDRPSDSKKYLKQARAIIDSEASQVVRKKQLANYLKTGKTGL
jgi:tetratricopeptide (TPR) repeat protein